MRHTSQRLVFTSAMTFLATLSGTAYAAYELSWQPDVVVDVVKIGVLLAIGSACVSFVVWTLSHLGKDSVFRGGIGGLITGLAIVPIPYFTSTLKTEFSRIHTLENGASFISSLKALLFATKTGLETFLIISKVSLIAVISSVILGVIIAKIIPPRPDET